MNLIHQMRALVREHDALNERALQLWTWLPSYHFAKKAHGDYVDEFQPTLDILMSEACLLLSYLSRENKVSPDEARQWFVCHCEECQSSNVPALDEIVEVLSKYKSR